MTCLTCELVAKRDSGEAPLWDSIFRTQYWDVVHSYNSELLGWLVVVPRRHMEAIAEMRVAESTEFGVLLRDVSATLKEVTGCLKTYVMQFAEHSQHPHVHFHVVPRMADQPIERKACKTMAYLGVSDDVRVSEDAMNELGKKIRTLLNEKQLIMHNE